MVDSQRTRAVPGAKANRTAVDTTTRLDETPGVGIEQENSAVYRRALFGDGQLISRFHRAQQIQTVQNLQHSHGNAAVARALSSEGESGEDARPLQRAPVASPHQPANKESPDDYHDLLDGFNLLVDAAVNQGGRRLDTVHFGGHLSSAHRSLLESIRKAFILAQDASQESRHTAVVMWSPLDAKLRATLEGARHAGLPGGKIDLTIDNLNAMSQMYIHAPPRKDAHLEGSEDHVEFGSAIVDLWKAHADHYKNLDAKRQATKNVRFGEQLTVFHRGLLNSLRKAILLVYADKPGSGHAALALWESIHGDIAKQLGRAESFGVNTAGASEDLSLISEWIIRPGAYYDAHQHALEHVDLQAPDLVFQGQRLKEETKEWTTVKEFAEKTWKATGENIIDKVLHEKGLGKEIIELVESPGEFKEKWKELKEKGLLGRILTAAELVDKVVAFQAGCAKLSFVVLDRYAETMLVAAERQGAEEAVKQWKAIGKGFKKGLATIEKVAKVVQVVATVISAVKVLDALWEHRWADAASEAGDLVIGLVGVTNPLGAAVMIIKAEIEAIHMAAEIIRWCKQETIRQAAGEFITDCALFAKNYAFSFVADVEAYLDPANAGIQDLIQKQLARHAPEITKGLKTLYSDIECTQLKCIGGHGDLVYALGQPALEALSGIKYPDDPLSKAQQIGVIFAGANALAKYVHQHYADKPADEGAQQPAED